MSRHYPTVGINTGDTYRVRVDATAPGGLAGILLPTTPVGAVTVVVTSGGINTQLSGAVSLIGYGSRILPAAAYTVTDRLIALVDTPPANDVYSLDYISKVKPDASATASFTAGNDSLFAYVKVLLHFNGSNGGTTFTDTTARAWTASSSAVTSTAWSRFGTAAGLFPTSGSPLVSTASSSDLEITNQDFFIEASVNPLAVANTAGHYNFILSKDSPGGTRSYSLMINGDNAGKFGFSFWSGGSNFFFAGTTVAAVGSVYDIAVGRTGGVMYLFVNGVLENTLSVTTTSNNTSANVFSLGGPVSVGGLTQYQGYVDEFRFTLGVWRHTANYSVATLPFPDF